jgi:hypothetical protein
MPTTVNGGFELFVSQLTPSSAEVTAAGSHRSSVEAKLKNSFGVTNFFGTGSRESGTSVRYYSDLDYFASIPSQNQRDDSAYMLRLVKQELQERFPKTTVYVDTPAVVCAFGEDGKDKIEVVPAYYTGRDNSGEFNVYKIPEIGGDWVKSSPSVHNGYVTEVNNKLSKKVKQLIRLIKAIGYYNNIPISSFYLELRIAKWASNENSIMYSYDVRTMLQHLVNCELAKMRDPMGISGLVPAANTDNYREEALSKLKTALARANNARDAEEAGKVSLAYEWWDKVYGGQFPAYG